MPKAAELKRGSIVEIAGAPHIVKKVEAKSPSSRGAATLYKIRFNNMQSGQKLDESYKGDDFLKEIDCIKRQVQYSYLDGDSYIFMDLEDYTQHGLDGADIAEQMGYLTEGLEGITALLVDDKILGIELPQAVALTITDTAPGIKGGAASGRTKPAILSSGIEIQVPEYLENNEAIKVNTTTGKFISKA